MLLHPLHNKYKSLYKLKMGILNLLSGIHQGAAILTEGDGE